MVVDGLRKYYYCREQGSGGAMKIKISVAAGHRDYLFDTYGRRKTSVGLTKVYF